MELSADLVSSLQKNELKKKEKTDTVSEMKSDAIILMHATNTAQDPPPLNQWTGREADPQWGSAMPPMRLRRACDSAFPEPPSFDVTSSVSLFPLPPPLSVSRLPTCTTVPTIADQRNTWNTLGKKKKEEEIDSLSVCCASSHSRFCTNCSSSSSSRLLAHPDLQKHSHALTLPKVDTLLACRKDGEGTDDSKLIWLNIGLLLLARTFEPFCSPLLTDLTADEKKFKKKLVVSIRKQTQWYDTCRWRQQSD